MTFSVAFRLGDLLPFVHSCSEFVYPGERDLRDFQTLSIFRVDEVDVSELVSGENGSANLPDVGVPVVLPSGHLVEGAAAQFRSGGVRVAAQCHFVDLVAVRKEAKCTVLLDVGQDKIAGTVDRTVSAAASVGKADNPLYLRGLLPNKPDGFGDAVAFGVPGKVIVKSHAVKFQKAVPCGALDKTDDFLLVEARAVTQNAVKLSVKKCSEMQATVVDHLTAVVVRPDERVCNLGWNYSDLDFFCSTHSFTTM